MTSKTLRGRAAESVAESAIAEQIGTTYRDRIDPLNAVVILGPGSNGRVRVRYRGGPEAEFLPQTIDQCYEAA
jgi:hypothetical protein